MTYNDFKDLRRLSFQQAKTQSLSKIGSVLETSAVCAYCGIPLANYSYENGRYYTVHRFYHLTVNDFYYQNICADSKSCYERSQHK